MSRVLGMLTNERLGLGSDISHTKPPPVEVNKQSRSLVVGKRFLTPVLVFEGAETLHKEVQSQIPQGLWGLKRLTQPRDAVVTWYLTTSGLLFPGVAAFFTSNEALMRDQGFEIITVTDYARPEDILTTLQGYDERYVGVAEDSVVSPVMISEELHAAVYGVLCMVLGRTPNEYWKEFVSRRANNYESLFDGVLAATVVSEVPDHHISRCLQKRLAPMFSFKKQLVAELTSSMADETVVGQFCTTSMNLLRNSGMTHFLSIHEYVVADGHPIIILPLLRGDVEKYRDALKSWVALTEVEKAYAKILYPASKTDFMHRNRFPKLVIASIHIAIQRGNTSMANYAPYRMAQASDNYRELFRIIDSIEQLQTRVLHLSEGAMFGDLTGVSLASINEMLQSTEKKEDSSSVSTSVV